MSSKDIQLLLDDWPYEPGQIKVRRIAGEDDRAKIQMRINLGILQMYVEGRPDGHRPYDCDSLHDYHSARLQDYERRNGTDLGFSLTNDECREIREEALQYYHRYLANFVLEDYPAVTRDTQRNLDVLDMCGTYAEDEDDRLALEQYRPYILMMNARSKALYAMGQGTYRTALTHTEGGLKKIKKFFRDFGHPKAVRRSAEIHVLKALRKEIQRRLPEDPIRKTERMLKRALKDERYEEAARLRDVLESLRKQLDDTPGGHDL